MESLNIDVIGPGAWYLIHMLSVNSKNKEQINGFHEMINIIANNFFCTKCREHFNDNYHKYPPPKINDNNELFIWTVDMHNKVNNLNDKHLVNYRDALKIYGREGSTCNGNCRSKHSNNLLMPEEFISTLSSASKFSKSSKQYKL